MTTRNEGDVLLVRFWAKVHKTATCWHWIGNVCNEGYGRFRVAGRTVGAHRLAYELAKGPIPHGLEIDHLCNEPGCVNPDHLEAVTATMNKLRSNCWGGTNARKTECKRGHALVGENLLASRLGRRVCRACKRERQRDYEARVRNNVLRASGPTGTFDGRAS